MDTFEKLTYLIKKNPSSLTYYNDAYLYIKGLFSRDIMRAMMCSRQLKELCVNNYKDECLLLDVKKDIREIIFKVLMVEEDILIKRDKERPIDCQMGSRTSILLREFKNCYRPLMPSFKELPDGTVIYVALKSDFFVAEADHFRKAA